MIDLYYWPTPNGHKITLFLEETAMPYTIIPVNIGKGEQFQPEFLAISPNNRMPAIVDHTPSSHWKRRPRSQKARFSDLRSVGMGISYCPWPLNESKM